MQKLELKLARHPIDKKPYNAIKFSRFDGNGIPLYRVERNQKEFGAASALKFAFEQFGGHCFHCKKWMPAQPLSQDCTRDHLKSRNEGGRNFLHNLVFACGPCNRKKGAALLIDFSPSVGTEYLDALEKHIADCLNLLATR